MFKVERRGERQPEDWTVWTRTSELQRGIDAFLGDGGKGPDRNRIGDDRTGHQGQGTSLATQIPCMKNICMCYLKLKKFKECVEQCDEILQLEPECSKTMYRKAMALLELGDLQQSEELLKKCYFSNPKESEFQKVLA